MSALREIIAKFGVEFDHSQLKKGTDSIDAAADKLRGLGEKIIAALAVREVYRFFDAMTKGAKDIKEQATILGTSMQTLQEWNYAAKVAGVSAGTLYSALTRISGGRYDKKAMAQLGIDVKNTATGAMRPATDIFEDMIDKLSKMPNETERNMAAQKLLGRGYKEMMPLIIEGAEGLRELREEFKAMGGGFSEDFAKTSSDIQRNVHRLQGRWEAFKIYIAAQFLPKILEVTKKLLEWVPAMFRAAQSTDAFRVAVLAATLAVARLAGFSPIALGKLGILLLALEDIYTFFKGGSSLTGNILADMFPPDEVERIRGLSAIWSDAFGQPSLELFVVAVEEAMAKVVHFVASGFARAADQISDFLNFISWPIRKIYGLFEWIDTKLGNKQQAEWDRQFAEGWTTDTAKREEEQYNRTMANIEAHRASATERINANTAVERTQQDLTVATTDLKKAQDELAKATPETHKEWADYVDQEQARVNQLQTSLDVAKKQLDLVTEKQRAAKQANEGAPTGGGASTNSGKTPPPTSIPPDTTYETPLPPDVERAFQEWKKQYAPNDSGIDYDYRGAFVAGVTPDKNGHWPDRFKKPNHPTFSVESQYATGANKGFAGHWEGNKYINATNLRGAVTPYNPATAPTSPVTPPTPPTQTPPGGTTQSNPQTPKYAEPETQTNLARLITGKRRPEDNEAAFGGKSAFAYLWDWIHSNPPAPEEMTDEKSRKLAAIGTAAANGAPGQANVVVVQGGVNAKGVPVPPGPVTITTNNTFNFTVPPGTTQEQANNIANQTSDTLTNIINSVVVKGMGPRLVSGGTGTQGK